MTLSPMQPLARFYRHSGKVPAHAALIALLGAASSAAVLGSVFGAAEFYGHLIPSMKLMALYILGLTVGLGYAVGAVPTLLLIRYKARSLSTAFGLTTLGILVAFYAGWVFWIFTLFNYWNRPVPLPAIATPANLATFISKINAIGVWNLGDGDTPTGIILALFWLLEIGIVSFFALRFAKRRTMEKVFCDTCNTWGTERTLMRIRPVDLNHLKSQLIGGNFEALASATRSSGGADSWCDVILEGCTTCDNLQTLTINQTKIVRNKKRNKQVTTDILKRLVLTPEQTALLAVTAAELSVPTPSKSVIQVHPA